MTGLPILIVMLFGAMSIGVFAFEYEAAPERYVPNPRQAWKTEYILAVEAHRPALFETACENLGIETWADKIEFLAECEDEASNF